MPIGSAGFAAGPYTVTWNSVTLGLCRGEAQSPALKIMRKHQRIDNTNVYGNSLVGAIYLGRDVRFSTVLLEWVTGSKAALFPDASNFGFVGTLGVDNYDRAQALVLTAVAGSLAATQGPSTVTASKSALAENFPVDVLLGPPLREMPILMDCMPYLISSDLVNFAFT